MTPPTEKDEAATREEIDEKLIAAGWVIQDKSRLNLQDSLGIAVREMDTSTGPADYMLFIDGKACGILEAKREGTNLGHVAEQSAGYHRTYHHMSEKHLNRVVEFAGRHNIRELDTGDQMASVVSGIIGKRLKYKDLVG